MLVNWAKRTLPRPLVARFKRTLRYGLLDVWDALTGRREPLVPPRSLMFVGAGEFKKIGEDVFEQFRSLGLLRPDMAVLDVGSGIGRIARPFTTYLSPAGRYEGIDIDRTGVRWCQQNLTPRHPNFHFQVSDLYNKYYNPGGKWKASEYRFPFPDAQFDMVFLTSVFTHMFPADVDNYLKEIARVLKSGGRCYITWFLWNAESEALSAQGKAHFDFKYRYEGYRSMDESAPEQGIAMPEDYVLGLYAKHGLTLKTPVKYGRWCGRPEGMDFQDIVLAEQSSQSGVDAQSLDSSPRSR